MSDTGQQDRAYPRSEHKAVGAYLLGASCAGGKGGGACFAAVGSSMAVLEYRVPKFDVYNRKLVLRNPSFDVYYDAGSDADARQVVDCRAQGLTGGLVLG